ncbi:MAG: DUF1376 domain-containing protein [Proteobacteria bacterium]|nr:DUF1376 domain-containing protein [Pseudomonadota bacterium]
MSEPLTPPNCDLRKFPYMPVDVVRLRDSEAVVVLTPEEFLAAMLLWCAAWHQLPAASLPTDDRVLASLAGYGRDLEAWQKVRQGALRGFILCTDGRLYHPIIAEKAIEAQGKLYSQKQRTAAATAAKAAKRYGERDDYRDGVRNERRNELQEKGSEEKGAEEKKFDTDDAESAWEPPPVVEQNMRVSADFAPASIEAVRAMPERDGGRPKMAEEFVFQAAIVDGQDANKIIAAGYPADAKGKGTAGAARSTATDALLTSRPWASNAPAWQRTAGYGLAQKVASIAGRGDEFEITGWGGAAQRVEAWLEKDGWTEVHILASVREQAARKADPPHSINYFEKGIAEHIARQSAPLPTATAARTKVNYRSKNTGDVVAAADALVDRIRRFSRPPALRGEEDDSLVRIVSLRGGE